MHIIRPQARPQADGYSVLWHGVVAPGLFSEENVVSKVGHVPT